MLGAVRVNIRRRSVPYGNLVCAVSRYWTGFDGDWLGFASLSFPIRNWLAGVA
jgi:hypothetical protein